MLLLFPHRLGPQKILFFLENIRNFNSASSFGVYALSSERRLGVVGAGGGVWVVHCDALYGPHDSLSSGIMHLLREAEITALRMSASEALTRASRADLPGIRALVWLPCDMECASLWPLFAAGIPVAAPSLELLLEWEQVFVLTVLHHYPSVR